MEIRSKKLHLHTLPVLVIVTAVLALGIGVLAQVLDSRYLKDGLTTFNSAKPQDNINNLGDDATEYLKN